MPRNEKSRRARGLCARCGRPCAKSYECKACRARHVGRAARRREANQCARCGKPSDTYDCAACTLSRAARHKRQQAEERAAKVGRCCTKCSRPLLPGSKVGRIVRPMTATEVSEAGEHDARTGADPYTGIEGIARRAKAAGHSLAEVATLIALYLARFGVAP